MPTPTPNGRNVKTVDSSKFPSSHGDSSVVQTPKDVHPGEAANRDITERNVTSTNPDEREEAMLDDAVELSFPASDPIAVPSITKIEDTDDVGAPEPEKEPPLSPARKREH